MWKSGVSFVILLVLLTTLTGCWNRRELNELGIQMGTAIDKVGDQYQVTVQVVVPGEVSTRQSSGRSTVTSYKATAPTLFEAFRKLTETSPRKIYSAHIRVLILGESLVKDGITNVLDILSRNPEARTDFYILVARDVPAEKVLKILTSLEKIPASHLFYSLDTSAKTWSPTTTVTLDQLIDQLVTEGLNPVLTGVKLLGDQLVGEEKKSVEEIKPAAMLRNVGLAVFKKDRLVGWLNEDESKGYNYIRDNVKSSAGHVSCPKGGLIGIETIRSHTKLKGTIVKGEPVIHITVRNESNVTDAECQINLDDPQTIALLEKESEDHLIDLMRLSIEDVRKKYNVDIFGFGQAIHQANPKVWNRLKADWDEIFLHLKVEYDVQITLKRIGTTVNSIKNDIKE
ncbi:Ger(x)C family spore germination protein [Paenibacillus sp. SYP-B3998]|uniref:Ger(X)C family spore germination protein n=1 Tax=Paenibacillus sp. SYP-B3998 TaxID=2678564 RepID=A0A6G4A2H5_9BACL|nr:Ger(x)C family spore germination protein [Paenibacillus sp. SYP-B3998]NEW08530.1 Ger(x)C family spore germination protein [Paenibacillus sp. SYP-B3998]